jgi:phage protein D
MSMTDVSTTPSYRSTRGRVPVFRPMLNGAEFEVTVKEMVVQLGDHAHDAVIMSCTSSTLTDTEGMLDSAISFYYGQAPRTELFCGYVVGVTLGKAGQGNLTFTLTLLGATQPMQKGSTRFWLKRTVPSVVEVLAAYNGLGFTAHVHTHLWDSIAQTEESDWQEAVKLTKRLGWSLFNRQGVLLCHDPNELMRSQGAYTRLVSSDQSENTIANEDRRLIEFTPSEKSDEVPQSMGAQIAFFTDNGDVQVTKEIGNFKEYKFITEAVIRNATEAAIYTEAAKSRMMEWKQRADARMWGDADIYPGMCVDVVTANRAYLRAKYDGRWVVQAVQHKMDTSQYQTNLRLVRPGSDTQITNQPYKSFWQALSRPYPTLSLQDGKWVSSWSDPRLRGVL